MLRSLHLSLFTLALGNVLAQDPADTAYSSFVVAYRNEEAQPLQELSAALSSLPGSENRTLSLLAQAAYYLRMDHVKEALRTLDSLDAEVPDHLLLYRAIALKLRALGFKRIGALTLGIGAIEPALAIIRRTGRSDELADMLVVRAELRRRNGDLPGALADLLESEHLAQRSGYVLGVGNVLLNRGNIFYDQHRDEEAWSAYSNCLAYCVHNDLRPLANSAVMNLGSTAHVLKRYDEAIRIYDSLFSSLSESQFKLRADILGNSALAHSRIGRYSTADSMFAAAASINEHTGNRSANAKILQLRSNNLWLQGHRSQALLLLDSALALATRNGMGSLRAQIIRKAAEWYSASGRPTDANNAWQSYVRIKDSLDQQGFNDRIANLEIQYETEKKDQRIKVQQLELEKSQADARRNRIQRNVLIGGLLVALLVGWLMLRNLQQKKTLAEQQRTISDQRVEEVLRTQELKLVSALVEGQELERKRIGQELHDRLGSMLSAIKLHFSAIETWIDHLVTEQRDQFKNVFRMLDDAVTEVRRVSHDMARSTVSQFGLQRGLEDLAATIAVPGKLQVELSTFGLEQKMDPKLEIALYRMVQEMVSNALKHARADHLTIQLTRSAGAVNLIVEDNGKGFDPTSAKEGMGMGNLRTRAAEFKGLVQIDSKPGRGTSISIDVPLS